MAFALELSLLARGIRGEAAALTTIVAMLSPHIEQQLVRYPVADEDRRDLLQVTLLRVVRCLASFRGDSSFSTWLFRVTSNEALMLMRSQRRLRACIVGGLDFDQLALLPGANDSITSQREDDTIANRERDDRVKSALAELPETYRAVLALHYAQDLGLREIADRLDLTEGAVRSRLHRARARLRSLLDGTALSPAARDGSRPAAAA